VADPEPLPPIAGLWDFGKPDETERRFRALLPRARASGDRAYVAELLTQIARAEGLLQRFDAADRTLAEAESLLGPGTDRARVLVLLERGRVLNSSKRAAEAKPLFVRAWDEARAARLDGLAVDAAHMVAIVEGPGEALAWNERAMAFAEASPDPEAKKWLGSLYNNLGWDHHRAGRFGEAMDCFRKSLAWREARSPGKTAVERWCVARCLRSLGRVDEALAEQRRLLAEGEASGEPDGFVHEEMAECLLALGRKDESRPHFRRAHELLSKDPWLSRDDPARLARLEQLGR
jgi:tetratricopeptide (TPR) repeat protein